MNSSVLTCTAGLGPWPAVLLAVVLGVLAFCWYKRRLVAHGAMRWVLPGLRATAVMLAALLAAQPLLTLRTTVGAVQRVVVVLDASASMGVVDPSLPEAESTALATAIRLPGTAAAQAKELAVLTRWQRLERAWCQGPHPLLGQLADGFDVDVVRHDGTAGALVWSSRLSTGGRPPPLDLGGAPTGTATDLAALLGMANAPGERPIAVVALSDGRGTAGVAATPLAQTFAKRGTRLDLVAIGSVTHPADAAIEAIELPDQVHARDRLAGTIRWFDALPAGQAVVIKLTAAGLPVGEWKMTADGSGRRQIPFTAELAPALAALLGDTANGRSSVLLPVAATVEVAGGDAQPGNDRAEAWTRVVLTQRAVLVVDGRPRWEWRYLTSLLERDEQWALSTVLPHDGTLAHGPQRLPLDRAGWLALDTVVLGDVDLALFTADELAALRDFVELRGGGLVLLDGHTGSLAALANTPAAALLPIRRRTGGKPAVSLRPVAGVTAPWLRLAADPAIDRARWAARPAPEFIADAEVLPGSETLLEAVLADGTPRPVVVTRRFGAGRVAWVGSDESWRWRSIDGPQATSSFWNQLLRTVSEEPYAVSAVRTAFDPGGPRLAPGGRPQMRARLRTADGAPRSGAHPTLVIQQATTVVARIALSEDAGGTGRYAALGPVLPGGTYTVRLAEDGGEPTGDSAILVVETTHDGELADTTSDRATLAALASAAHGTVWDESASAKLVESLTHEHGQQVIEHSLSLWTSWWWFTAIAALLSIELLLRRRLGLP